MFLIQLFTIHFQYKIKLFLAKPWPSPLSFSVVPIFCVESHFSGNVLCSQQSTVINPDEFVDYSLELLVEPVRGANSSTERHNIAAHTLLQMIIGGLDQVLCAMYTHRPNPDADVLPLDRRHNGGEGGDQVQQESNLNFNFLQNGGRRQVSEVIQIDAGRTPYQCLLPSICYAALRSSQYFIC